MTESRHSTRPRWGDHLNFAIVSDFEIRISPEGIDGRRKTGES